LSRKIITICAPITLNDAFRFIAHHDRLHESSKGGFVALGLWEDETLIGVGILGRAKSQAAQAAGDVELTQLCILSEIKLTTAPLCRIRREAKALGFNRVLTTGMVPDRSMADKVAKYYATFGQTLPGEDRTFGGNTFYVDLLPPSAHFHNLRTYLALNDWKTLSQYVIQRAERRCEICGSQERPEAHERWRFNPEFCKQDAARLMCVCKKCHLGIHYSLPGYFALREDIDAHIMAITGWDKAALSAHVKERSEVHARLSALVYEVDLSLIERIGITPLSPAVRASRITAAQANVGIFDSTDKGQAAMERYLEREFRRLSNPLLG
jgi:hypothetical protein